MSRDYRNSGQAPSTSGGRGEGEGVGPGKSTQTQKLDTSPKPGGSVVGSPDDGAVKASTGPVKLNVENDKKAPTGGTNRTTVGLGERIFVTPEPLAEGKFSSTAGSGKDEGTLYTWDAPDTVSKVTITFKPKDGGTPSTVEINVIAPDKVEFQDKKELSYGNVSAAGMKVKAAFLPFTVSFANLDWQEKDVDPSKIEGWFTSQPADQLKHKKGPGGYLDAKNKADDWAEWKSSVVVKEKSALQWDIPQTYSVNGGTAQKVPNQPFTQLMTIDTNGTTTVSKNGQTVTRAVPKK